MRILILHSKIDAKMQEEEMLKFENKEYDLLLSTSIVESGIDLPNANTIIVEKSDRFGMADLHQLRGRVGRSDKQGYCYF
ncbi:helicase-related protein [Campylobacter jejuni]